MHFNWILLIFSCLILFCATSGRRYGGGGTNFRSSSGFSHRASSFSRPSISASPRFSSSPSLSSRSSRPKTFQTLRPASAPPLSSLTPSTFPNSLHTPSQQEFGIPKAPGLRPPLLSEINWPHTPSKSSSAIPQPPPMPPTVPTNGNIPKNVPKKESTTVSETAIIPVAVKPIMTIPMKRNTTNSQGSTVNPQNPNISFGYGNMTSQADSSKVKQTNLSAAGNSSAKSFESNIKPVKVNEMRGSSKNSTQNWGTISNSLGRNATANHTIGERNVTGGYINNFGNSAKRNNTMNGFNKNVTNNLGTVANTLGTNITSPSNINGTLNAFPSSFSGNNTKKNVTLNTHGSPAFNGSLGTNHTRQQNYTGNSTGFGFPTGVSPITITTTNLPPTIGSPLWQAGNDAASAQNPNMPSWDNPAPKSDETNGDSSHKLRNNMVGNIAKTIVKSVASKQSSKAAKNSLDGNLNGNSWDSNRSDFAAKSTMSKTTPTPQSKIKKYQIILITVLISVVLIAGGVLVYFCNRK